jgi:hypothetical protein
MNQSTPIARIHSFEEADYSKPFVIEGVTNHWPAFEKWTWDFFKEQYGDKSLFVFRADGGLNLRKTHSVMGMREYVDYILNTADEHPFYLVDYFVHQNMPELLNDFTIPKEFKSWFDRLPHKVKPKFLSLYIGPEKSMSQLHFDIMNTVAWNACFAGTKKWYFYPPSEADNIYYSEVNVFNPDYEKFPKFANAKGYHLTQKAGDLVYTPPGWWHTVQNLEPSIALTDNFVNHLNIKRFFTHFFPATKHLLMRTWKRRATPRNQEK